MCAGVARDAAARSESRDLVVCADPDNLPFSHQDGSGFENRIAELSRKTSTRGSSIAGCRCDAAPSARRSGGAVRRADGRSRRLRQASPRRLPTIDRAMRSSRARTGARRFRRSTTRGLRTSRIGVPLIGADGAAAAAGIALARRGIWDNVTGFPVYGAVPVAQRMVDALVAGELDIAVGWGPHGRLLRATWPRSRSSLALAPDEALGAPNRFAIAIAVRDDEERAARRPQRRARPRRAHGSTRFSRVRRSAAAAARQRRRRQK